MHDPVRGSTNTAPALKALPIKPTGKAPLEAGPADHRGDLPTQLLRPALVQVPRYRVAVGGLLGCLRGECRDLALGQRLGVDAHGERLHIRDLEELNRRLAQRGLRARAIAVAQRRLDRLDPQPVAAALVSQQMPPATGPPGASVRAHPEHVAAGARDHPDPGLRTRRRGPRRDDVVDDDPVLGALRMYVPSNGGRVGAGERDHRRAELLPAIPAFPTASSAACSSARTAAPVPTASSLLGPPWPMCRPCSQVEHRGERLRRATVDPQHETRALVLPGVRWPQRLCASWRCCPLAFAPGGASSGGSSTSGSRFTPRSSQIPVRLGSSGCWSVRSSPERPGARGCTSRSTCAPSRRKSLWASGSATPCTSGQVSHRVARCGARSSTQPADGRSWPSSPPTSCTRPLAAGSRWVTRG